MCRDAADSHTLRAGLRSVLHRWVPFDAFCVNTCDPFTLVVTSSVGDGLSPRAASRLFEIESSGTDVNALASLATLRVPAATASKATRGDVRRSRRMRDIFLPLGLGDELRAPLFAGDECWGYLHLFRAKLCFSDLDSTRIAQIAPEIGLGLRRTTTRRPAVRPHIEHAEHVPGMVVVGSDGRAKSVAGGVNATLRSLDLDGHQPVPHAVYGVAQPARRAPSANVSATVRTPHGHWLSLHGVAYEGRGAALVYEASPRRIAPLVLLGLGLTRREREVARWLLAGHSNEDIARELGIRTFTVKDHVKRIFAKTRTSGRAELMAALHGL